MLGASGVVLLLLCKTCVGRVTPWLPFSSASQLGLGKTWVDAANITAEDASYASVSLDAGEYSDFICGNNIRVALDDQGILEEFEFETALVTGMEVQVRWSGAKVSSNGVGITLAGATVPAVVTTPAAPYPLPSTTTITIFSDSEGLMGYDYPINPEAASFGACLHLVGEDDFSLGRVENIKVRVTYTVCGIMSGCIFYEASSCTNPFNRRCVYGCASGYTETGNGTEGFEYACIPNDCEAASTFDVACPTPASPGATCDVTCHPGTYDDATDDGKVMCNAGSWWYLDYIFSFEMKCKDCDDIANCIGMIECSGRHDETCSECAPGFAIRPSPSGELCAEPDSCTPLPVMPSMVRVCGDAAVPSGSSCSLSCADGYYGDTVGPYVCDDGGWTSTSPPVCMECAAIAGCDVVTCSEASTSVCASCSEGYSLESGACVGLPCLASEVPVAGPNSNSDCTGSISAGGVCVLVCDASAFGTAGEALCTAGTWGVSSSPTCTACTAVENCKVLGGCASEVDSECLDCDAFYELDSTGLASRCNEKKCEQLSTPAGVARACADGSVPWGNKCSLICAPGYFGTASPEHTCVLGEWDATTLPVCSQCTEVSGCAVTVTCTSTTDSRCSSCSPGYALDTTGAATVCRREFCTAMPTTAASRRSCGDGDIPLGDTCSLQCGPGFYGNAGSVSSCTSEGWTSYSQPDCQPCTAVEGCNASITCSAAVNSLCPRCAPGLVLNNDRVPDGLATRCESPAGPPEASTLVADTTESSGGTGVVVALLVIVVVILACVVAAVALWVARSKQKKQARKKKMFAAGEEGDGATVKIDGSQSDGMRVFVEKLLTAKGTARIGGGGAADVFKVHLDTGEWVALKRLRVLTEQAMAEFHQEANILSKLGSNVHVNVVQMKFYCNDPPCIAMELCEQGSLEDFLLTNPEKAVVQQHLASVADGMCHLHEKSLAHLDLKPRNVLINEAGVVKITDFGISMEVGMPHLVVGFQGTPQYSAPERFAIGSAIDLKKCDVFSFGVTIWRAVTGLQPFSGKSTDEVAAAMQQVCSLPEESIAHLPLDGVEAEDRSLILRCIAFAPLDRPNFAYLRDTMRGEQMTVQVELSSQSHNSMVSTLNSMPPQDLDLLLTSQAPSSIPSHHSSEQPRSLSSQP